MFNETIVVQSAISAFNNAALWAPAFAWWAILSLPLLFIVYRCATPILSHLGWTGTNIKNHISVLCAILTFAWIVLFGGNYGVLRDGWSALPLMTATIVFLTTLFVMSHRHEITHLRAGKRWRTITWLLIICAVGLSDTHAWWGPLLQLGALGLGLVLGRVARCEMRTIAGTLLIILTTSTAILMQPEFFRFGQLGNLTIVHLLFILALGIFAMATLALNNITPRTKIHNSAYVKLKWLMRCLTALCGALFILTESLPLFLGTLAVAFTMFAMSIWHSEKIANNLVSQAFAITLVLFGTITVMPAISALGILYWASLPKTHFWHDFKSLL